jgi:hypothetical protein
MVHRRNLPRLAAALALLPLAGCSLGGLLRGDDAIEVSEVRRLASCNTEGASARVSLLPGAEAVRAWQAAHGVELIGVDPLPSAGTYVLVEMGQRPSAGYGILVSRRALLGNGMVQLSASLITPAPGEASAEVLTSPCALVALPQGTYTRVELRDPAGELLARADAAAPVQ